MRLYQAYGGTRFVEDDLAGDPKAGALASNGQGPPSITDRLRSTADGAQAAAGLTAAPGRGGVRAPERAAPPGPGAAASADHAARAALPRSDCEASHKRRRLRNLRPGVLFVGRASLTRKTIAAGQIRKKLQFPRMRRSRDRIAERAIRGGC